MSHNHAHKGRVFSNLRSKLIKKCSQNKVEKLGIDAFDLDKTALASVGRARKVSDKSESSGVLTLIIKSDIIDIS